MRSRRIIASAVICIAGLLAAMPAAASAGSLLSGYGGPGEGSQVILGASLVNGPRGGGGSPGGGGSQGGSSRAGGGSTAGGESSTVATTGSPADRASSQRHRRPLGFLKACAGGRRRCKAGDSRCEWGFRRRRCCARLFAHRGICAAGRGRFRHARSLRYRPPLHTPGRRCPGPDRGADQANSEHIRPGGRLGQLKGWPAEPE